MSINTLLFALSNISKSQQKGLEINDNLNNFVFFKQYKIQYNWQSSCL